MKKRLVILLLVLCMVFTMMPMGAFATQSIAPLGISDIADSVAMNLCEHHTEHNEACGYSPA